jgi:large subunit ribosomal protein L15
LSGFTGEVDLAALKLSGLVGQLIKDVKVINTGSIASALVLRGVRATAGAKAAIEAAGGRVEA